MNEKTCCVIGDRNIPADQVESIRQELRREIEEVLAVGYTRFISGFGAGAELYFAEIIAEKRLENKNIRLEAAIPCRGRLSRLLRNDAARRLLLACTEIGVYGEKCSPETYLRRDSYISGVSGRIILIPTLRREVPMRP